MSNLKITYREVEQLIPYARNARTHNDAQVAQIAASIREFGFTNPVLLDDDNGIIAGHGRVLAARKLALDKVPCIELKHLSEAQKRAYVIADNQLALQAGWNVELLAIELGELKESDLDLQALGFDSDALDDLLNGWDPDPEAIGSPKDPSTNPNTVFKLICPSLDADGLRGVLQRAIEESGIKDVKLVEA
jgi:ParB-like chromosome segregation protein Spo0J